MKYHMERITLKNESSKIIMPAINAMTGSQWGAPGEEQQHHHILCSPYCPSNDNYLHLYIGIMQENSPIKVNGRGEKNTFQALALYTHTCPHKQS